MNRILIFDSELEKTEISFSQFRLKYLADIIYCEQEKNSTPMLEFI